MMALACDLRIAAEGSFFCYPEMTLGAFPGSGGPVRLEKLSPAAYAKEVLFTTRKVSAQEALQAGFLNKIVRDEELEEETEKLCVEIQRSTFQGVAAVKKIINSIQNHSQAYGQMLSNTLRKGLESTPEYVAGIDRHFEERKH